jgi:phosphate uptake regulator
MPAAMVMAHGVAAAVDVTLLGRYYERFADHAVPVGAMPAGAVSAGVMRGGAVRCLQPDLGHGRQVFRSAVV